jgi:hypothetical protein
MEIEIIEQIADEPLGRSVSWVCDFMKSRGDGDPLVTLRGMWNGGHLQFTDANGMPLPRWRCEQILRNGVIESEARVLATDKGAKWAQG